MPVNKNIFIHDTDKAALKTLEAIPGFSQVTKAFLSGWNERLMAIDNMATNLKVSEKQLPKYREMLLPICEKLEIEVPDLFIKLDVRPNAYTSGDSKPFIVMTTGLLESMPEELIPTVLAHECGHIACHHVLYRTMGTMIISGLFTAFPLGAVAIYPIKAAFANWMRASELSADRAAILADGTDEKLLEMCMRFAGYPKDMREEMNVEAFIGQAKEYKEMIEKDGMNKAMDFMMHSMADHPLSALRAYEAREWCKSESYRRSKEYFDACRAGLEPREFPLETDEKNLIGKEVSEVKEMISKMGFSDIEVVRNGEKNLFGKNNAVTKVTIGDRTFSEGEWAMKGEKVVLTYYLPYTDEEIMAMHPHEVKMPYSSAYYTGKKKDEVLLALEKLGFDYITTEAVEDVSRDNEKQLEKVIRIDVEGKKGFDRGEWIDLDTAFKIVYHERKN